MIGVFVGLFGGALAGCGANCQSACNKKYNISECAVLPPGFGDKSDQLIRECVGECERALQRPGEVGSYDPLERNTTGEAVVLENEKQAALWMDCIADSACDRIEDGYCPGP
jgi:hypothetical protein